MPYVVQNVTNSRISLRLHPVKAAAEGTPIWAAQRQARQQTKYVIIDPHITDDLTRYGFTEEQVAQQTEVLNYIRQNYLKHVVDDGYEQNEQVFDAVSVSELVSTGEVASAEVVTVLDDLADAAVAVESDTTPAAAVRPAVTRASIMRTRKPKVTA